MINVLFLTFANNQTNPLPTLQSEDDALYKALSPRMLQLHYLLHRDSHATIATIARDLQLFRNYVTVFHYSGHAGRDQLTTWGDSAAQSEGVAQLLAQCPQLKFVVLNGCSTEGQVQRLLDLGIPAVVATNAPVDDRKSTVFATRLYEALAQQCNLLEAFELAKGEVLMYDGTVHFGEIRGVGWQEEYDDTPCWGLFCREEKNWVLDEQLPLQTVIPRPQNFVTNARLEAALWQVLQRENPAIRSLIARKKADGEEITPRQIRIEILNNLPTPIAEQLRKLLVPVTDENQGQGYNKTSILRLRQIVRTYEFTLQLLVYILLGHLWEALLDNHKIFVISPEDRTKLNSFLRMPERMQTSYNYIALVGLINQLLDANKVAYFIEELPAFSRMYENSESFRGAIFFLELLRNKVRGSMIHPYEYDELCILAEENLAAFFSELGFFTRYDLISVQTIEVAKYPHMRQATFDHQVVMLSELLGGFDRSSHNQGKHTDSRSVLLCRKGEKMEHFINLSPFIVDENAFETNADVAKIFFYNHYDHGHDAYVYRFVNRPEDELRVKPADNPVGIGILQIQINAFLQLLNSPPARSLEKEMSF